MTSQLLTDSWASVQRLVEDLRPLMVQVCLQRVLRCLQHDQFTVLILQRFPQVSCNTESHSTELNSDMLISKCIVVGML